MASHLTWFDVVLEEAQLAKSKIWALLMKEYLFLVIELICFEQMGVNQIYKFWMLLKWYNYKLIGCQVFSIACPFKCTNDQIDSVLLIIYVVDNYIVTWRFKIGLIFIVL